MMQPPRLDHSTFSLCVFCGSQSGNVGAFGDAARAVGASIARRGGQLVYGGGHSGLMGMVADATLAAGGRVIGVIPKALVEKKWAHQGCTELHVVESMHERKRIMAEKSDAFLALPGGIGTLEEFFEVWTWRQLGYHDKPIGLLNLNGYYDKLLDFLAASQAQGFMSQSLMAHISAHSDAQCLLGQLVAAAQGNKQKSILHHI